MTVNDVEDFLAILRDHPEWQRRVREEILGERLLQLPDSVDRIDQRLAELVVIVDGLTVAAQEQRDRLGRVERHGHETDDRIDRLAAQVDDRFDRVEAQLAEMKTRVDSMNGRLGLLEGSDFERKFNAGQRIGGEFRDVSPVLVANIPEYQEALTRGLISSQDHIQVTSLDHLFLGRRRGAPEQVYIAFEVSKTVDRRDVERAANRAQILRKTGIATVAYAGGQRATQGARDVASARGVSLIVLRDAGLEEDDLDD